MKKNMNMNMKMMMMMMMMMMVVHIVLSDTIPGLYYEAPPSLVAPLTFLCLPILCFMTPIIAMKCAGRWMDVRPSTSHS